MGISTSSLEEKVARVVRTQTHANEDRSGQLGPIRLTIFCAALLTIIVVITAVISGYNLRQRTITENEQKLSQSALLLSHQLEQIFSTVVGIERSITDDLFRSAPKADADFDVQLRRHDLRKYVSSIPYLHDLAIFDSRGRIVNSLAGATTRS